jgi:hypothetical protein
MVALSRLLIAAVAIADAAQAQAQVATLCMMLDAALAFAEATRAQAPGSGKSQPSQRWSRLLLLSLVQLRLLSATIGLR